MRISDWSSDVCSSDLALHGALRAVGQGPRLARRRQPRHDHGNPRGPRCGQEQGPHLPAPRPSRPEDPARAPARHLGKRQDLCRRSEEHTSELQSLMRISYAVFCLKKKKKKTTQITIRERQLANSVEIDKYTRTK